MHDLLPKPSQNWDIISTERDWIPSEDDLGLFVALLCFPVKGELIGEPYVAVAKNPIQCALPKPVPFLRRHESCQKRAPKDRSDLRYRFKEGFNFPIYHEYFLIFMVIFWQFPDNIV